MIDYFSKRFELTEEGSKNLVKSIIYTVLGNISLMFPVGLYIGLLYLLITPLTGGEYIEPNLGIFILAILVVLGIIFILHYRQYYFLYTTTYTESGKRRINLAESLRKLPLAFFENRDLTDLSSTIMNDCTDLEHVFSHAIPQLTGSIITLIIITIGFLTFDWRLTIALLWPVPVSFAVLLIFKSLNEKYSEKLHYEVRSSTDGIQECIESIRDLKSYNYEKNI
ncbi:ABC transporter transmembrane domain-containing protein [Methanobrevibacter oralis]|uniref:ABC transporter transmembrane domain-containing protein n=1 Tax=Methanobrevibacter oralis TaxID=66851 RepID=UPI000AD27D53|nr:ABC transporter transmembrane domain-containing protein [Methanobrevibacter oralis]